MSYRRAHIGVGLLLGFVACGDGKPAIKIHRYDEGLPDAQPMVDGHAIIGKEAVGPLRIGMWRRPAMSFVYAIGARQGKDDTDVITVKGLGRDTVTVWFQDDTLRRIVVLKPGPHTAAGIRIGTPVAALAPSIATRSAASQVTWSLPGICGVELAAGRSPAADTVTRVRSITVRSCAR